MPLGVHTSIAGGLYKSIERASALGCDAMQIFGRNPRSWQFNPVPSPDISLFRSKREESGIWPVAIHTTYLINLCSPDTIIYDKSASLFKNELSTAEALGADYLVTHLGSPQDMGAEFAITRILSVFKEIALSGLGKKTAILVENTAGSGYGFGSSLEDIGKLLDGAEALGLKAGFCLDTCHAFTAGYPLKTVKEVNELILRIEKEAGLERLKVIHLNDSKGAFGSKIDRHEHIGEGKIGIEGFRALLSSKEIQRIPMILETPKKSDEDDPRNLLTVREILGNVRPASKKSPKK